ncbi:MAG: glycosyltransferase family 2 protein [Anaerolineae bacterium]|nr:glycosyltransferase family 2 protein [Anaerolineae bacterium]
MPPLVTVIILNWNGRHYLAPCLDALEAQTFRDFEIVLVDNGSVDGSVELLRSAYPNARLMINRDNVGFAAGNNQAVRATHSAFVATLNNDTQVEPGWLAALVEAMESDARVGMCASKMLFAHRRDMINSAGISADRAGIAWDRLGGARDDLKAAAPEPIFGPCAGAALYRRAMLDEVGLFDEDFFAYLEDVDLAWRAQLAGWHALYVPLARVYHHHSGTAGEGSPLKNRLLGRNKVWTIVKDYPLPHLLWYLPIILSYDLAAVMYAVVRQRDVSPLSGRLAALRGIPGMLRRRRKIQQEKRISSGELLRLLDPLSPPWRVPERYTHLKPATRTTPAPPSET